MKNTSIFFFIILFVSCAKTSKHGNQILLTGTPKKTETSHLFTNQNKKSHIKYDSVKSSIEEKSPVKIINALLSKNHYSDHKDIKVTFKNSGRKTIKAIKFEWFCLNSFDEPANGKYFYGEGKFRQNSIHLLKPGATKTEFWEDFSTDANQITKVRAYHIIYTDGSKWDLYKDTSAF